MAGGVSNTDQFELYFKTADSDQDGRIRGAEAVSFFQASGLPRPVLAKIWAFVDENRTGYLGRPEFYNALKLVTVAQSKRDLTSDIVKAALYGPASAKIPAPQINPVAAENIPSGQSWPKMTQSNVQKYTKVFAEVDTDRDGKITGEQARTLFLSWRLPRDILKQVWDLSDQDKDSMLSLNEFCIAHFLMERHREDHPLPKVLPDGVMFEGSPLSPADQTPPAYPRPAPGSPLQLDSEIEKAAKRLRKQNKLQKEPTIWQPSPYTNPPTSETESLNPLPEPEPEPEPIIPLSPPLSPPPSAPPTLPPVHIAEERTMRQSGIHDVTQPLLCINYPNMENFELRSGLIHLLPIFRGLENEDPHKFLKEFHVVCSGT